MLHYKHHQWFMFAENLIRPIAMDYWGCLVYVGFFFRFIVTVMMTIVSTFLLFAFDKDLIMLMLNVTIVIYIVVLFNGVKYIHVDLLITIIIMKE